MSDIQLKYYQAPGRIMVAIDTAYNSGSMERYIINGVDYKPTHDKSWGMYDFDGPITSIAYYDTTQHDNGKLLLKDPTSAIEGVIPIEIPRDETLNGYIPMGSKYHKYSELYELVVEKLEPVLVNMEFDTRKIGDVELTDIHSPITEVLELSGGSYDRNTSETNVLNIITYCELERIANSKEMLVNRPCSISSVNSYRIIRAFVKSNIDRKYATITSDYDFCFEIAKNIVIKPYTIKKEITKSNGRGYAKPRYNINTIEGVKIPRIFEMTHSDKNYGKYTPIAPFEGDDYQDLLENVRLYLSELLAVIQAPLHMCESCDGAGVINVRVKSTN